MKLLNGIKPVLPAAGLHTIALFDLRYEWMESITCIVKGVPMQIRGKPQVKFVNLSLYCIYISLNKEVLEKADMLFCKRSDWSKP